ncbi:MAG: DedA family protein [Candidatus Peribacteraceae bacterium]|nr:DedA family protein [Candidatus Peribacteraceae bacterium]
MEFLISLFNFFLHIDTSLGGIIAQYGQLTYGILFVVLFCETGLVVTPFLPGDSLLFAAGAFAAVGSLRIEVLVVLLGAAAILGDTVNYSVGHFIGPRAFTQDGRFLKREYMERTHRFFERYGKKAIVLARFVPIIRTFAPFVAGIGGMHYGQFITYNIIGGMLWVVLFTVGGYLFGNAPIVREYFGLVVLAIIILSLAPIAFEWWQHRKRKKTAM